MSAHVFLPAEAIDQEVKNGKNHTKRQFYETGRRGHPEYVPYFTMMGEGYLGEVADVMMSPAVFGDTFFMDGGKDMWGVPYRATEGTADATMPDTRIKILPDIEDWRKYLKYPDIPRPEEIDWEKQYQKDLAQFQVDRTQSAVKTGPQLMPFQELVAMMGFTEGLMALYTDPDEVLNMFHAMVDFLEPYYTRYIDVYKPDLWYMLDDTCAKEAPFFSPETYRAVFIPIYERLAKPANDRGIPIIFHICGRFDPFLDDMVDFGVKIVEPTQESNDLLMLKENTKVKLDLLAAGTGETISRPSIRNTARRSSGRASAAPLTSMRPAAATHSPAGLSVMPATPFFRRLNGLSGMKRTGTAARFTATRTDTGGIPEPFRGGMNVKFLIVGGFLGSGKTSFILALARYLVQTRGITKVAILENEIGEVGVDDRVLRG